MKKKSLFRKATALICCIAMCITTFMPAIYAVAGNGSNIVVTVPDTWEYYSEFGDRITNNSSNIDCDGYMCSYTNNKITFSSSDEKALAKDFTATLYVKADKMPSNSSTTTRLSVAVAEDTAYDCNWRIEFTVKQMSTRADHEAVIEAAKTQYTVSFSSTDCDILNKDNGAALNGIYTYNEGDTIRFTVDAGSQPGKTVTVLKNRNEADPLKPDENGVYSVTVTNNMTISAKVVDEVFEVTGPKISEQNGYTYTPASSESVAYGGSFSFYVTPADGWTVPTVKNGDTVLTSVGNNLYVINNITEPVTINVERGSLVQHSVVYPTGVGYEITNNSNTVTDNTDLTFTVAPSDAAYEIKSVTATVGGKAAAVEDNKNGMYTILNVKGDVVISVNAQKKMLDVTVDITDMEDKATTTAANGKVEYGTQYSFYVTPVTGHGNATVYLVKGETQTPVNPVTVNGTQYVVTVTENTKIKIVGAELNSYNVTLNNGTGFVYQNAESSVQHDKTYTFEVKVDADYNKSKPVVSVNNVVIAATNNGADGVWIYEIKNVTENKVVSVSGLQRNTYKVTLQGGAGYNFSTNESTTVEHNGSFTFRVDIMSGYKADSLDVKYGETTVKPDENGNYKIDNITSDVTVTVDGVKPSTSKVAAINSANASVNGVEVNKEIAYNGYVTFTVKPQAGYRVENVFVNGERKDALDGTYRVNNITSDITIDVRTVANKLTVNYVSTEKNHTVDKTATYTIENISTVLSEKLDDCIVHSFNGWNYNGAKADVSALTALIAENDNTATLTAEFGLKDDKAIADSLLKLADTTKEQTQVGEKYRTTFRTVIEILEKVDEDVDPCVRDYVKVTAHGTLLANSANADFAGKVDALKGRDKTSTGEIKGATVVDKTMYNYYVNCNYTWSTFYSECQNPNNAQIVLRITSSTKETTLNAAGWVELSIGNTNIYIISDESGQNVTVAAK